MQHARQSVTIRLSFLLLAIFVMFSQAVAATESVGVQLRQADDSGVKIRVVSGAPQLSPVDEDGSQFQKIELEGYDSLAEAGRPALPLRRLLVAIPAGATAHVTAQAAQTQLIRDVRPLPAPQQMLGEYDVQDAGSVPRFISRFDAVRQAELLYPTQLAVAGPPQRLRDWRVIEIAVHPVQADQAGDLRWHRVIDIDIRFDYPNGRQTAGAARSESAVFETLLANRIINWQTAQQWRARSTQAIGGDPNPCVTSNAYRIEVEKSGMYRIDFSDLNGFPAGIAVNQLTMCNPTQKIAIEVVGEGVFDSSDYILFYGESIDRAKNHDARYNVYWLTFGGGTQPRMGAVAQAATGTAVGSYIHTEHLERDREYWPDFPLVDNQDKYDHWFDEIILYDGLNNGVAERQLVVSALDATRAVSATVKLFGFSSNQHKVDLTLNGAKVADDSFFGNGKLHPDAIARRITASADGSTLHNGTNRIGVAAVANDAAEAHNVLIDWFEISYGRLLQPIDGRLLFDGPAAPSDWQYTTSGFAAAARVFDVTNAAAPRTVPFEAGAFTPQALDTVFPPKYAVVDPGRFLDPASITADSPSNLRGSANRADYIIITDPSLNDALQPLIALRKGQGLAVRVAFVQDIFDEFSGGVFNTEAIADFVEYAYSNWSGTAPTYALLAGDASHDPRDVLGNNNGRNFVPVYLHSGVDSFLGEAAADNQYVTFDGVLPSLLLGRLPASSSSELSNMVDKIIAYETSDYDPLWHGRHLFVSDNEQQDTRQSGCDWDPAARPPRRTFFQISEAFINYVPFGHTTQRLFYAHCYENSAPKPAHYSFDPLDMRARFVSQFNQGAGFVTYVGHASITSWGDERFVTLSQAKNVGATNKPAIMLPMACLEGQYHRYDLKFDGLPTDNGVSEQLIKRKNGGAVASYAATGLQVTTGHDILWEGFMTALFDDQAPVIGAAVFGAKSRLGAGSAYADLHDTFMLLGDPALTLKYVDYDHTAFVPIMRRQ